jgi:hypothetical protein
MLRHDGEVIFAEGKSYASTMQFGAPPSKA